MSKRSGIQLCYPFEEKRLLDPKFGWKFPVLVQPKLDGERCRLLPHILPDIQLISSECNPINSVPHIEYALRSLEINVELDGELYCHGMEFAEIHSIVSRKSTDTLHPDAWKIKFHIFDIINEKPQLERLAELDNLIDPLVKVDTYACTSMQDIFDKYNDFLDEGYEGIIIRHIGSNYIRRRSTFVLKFKPKKFDDYEIVGVEEAISKTNIPLEMVGRFICRNEDGSTFAVGAGHLNHHRRAKIWRDHTVNNDVVGRWITIQYQHSERSVPRFGLAVEVH